jgi:exosortase/archaeosortase family protein
MDFSSMPNLFKSTWDRYVPPLTARNAWLLIAATVAIQNIVVFHTSQNESMTVFALLIWGGALICMEDLIEHLHPSPNLAAALFASVMLLFVLFRTSIILHSDGVIFLLPPIAVIALVLLVKEPRSIFNFRDSLFCVLLFPANALLNRIIPEVPMSLLTAKLAAFWLSILGLDPIVNRRDVFLKGGGVTVLGSCNGLDMISQVVCIAIIFLLAFRLRSTISRMLILLLSPIIGLLSNTFSANGSGHGYGFWFDFFHNDTGSLIFSGLAVFVFGSIYMRFLEHELGPETFSGEENREFSSNQDQ